MKRLITLLCLITLLGGCGQQETTGEALTTNAAATTTENRQETVTEGATPTAQAPEKETEAEKQTTAEAETKTETEAKTEAETTTAQTIIEQTTTAAQAQETTTVPETQADPSATALNGQRIQYEETRAVWVAYLDLLAVFEAGGEEHFRQTMRTMVLNSKDLGMNTIMFQVRPFGDALYPSERFPTSYVITGTEGDPLAYDPLTIAIEEAHREGLRLEAWINPYRIRTASSTVPLSEGNIAKTWLEDNSRRVLRADNGIIAYNPAKAEVRQHIAEGVAEIIQRYAVDGIHFDDYFYPTTNLSFDQTEFWNYEHDNDDLGHEDWRRYNVNTLIELVYATIKESGADVVFGISPQGDFDANYEKLYADVALWMTTPGYLDYIMPQIYYGFDHSRLPYAETLALWHSKNSGGHVALMPGLAAYKVGHEDQWAGAGKEEWVNREAILATMVTTAQNQGTYKGFGLFRYNFLFKPEADLTDRILTERDALQAVIKK